MAFWKKAVASLGLISILYGAPAKGDETKPENPYKLELNLEYERPQLMFKYGSQLVPVESDLYKRIMCDVTDICDPTFLKFPKMEGAQKYKNGSGCVAGLFNLKLWDNAWLYLDVSREDTPDNILYFFIDDYDSLKLRATVNIIVRFDLADIIRNLLE